MEPSSIHGTVRAYEAISQECPDHIIEEALERRRELKEWLAERHQKFQAEYERIAARYDDLILESSKELIAIERALEEMLKSKESRKEIYAQGTISLAKTPAKLVVHDEESLAQLLVDSGNSELLRSSISKSDLKNEMKEHGAIINKETGEKIDVSELCELISGESLRISD